MRRAALIVFTVHTLSFHALSLGHDSWFGPDKAKHFFLGAFVQSAAFSGLRVAGLGKSGSMAGASAVTLTAIGSKELWDRQGHGTPSWRDVVWGAAGAAAISPALARAK